MKAKIKNKLCLLVAVLLVTGSIPMLPVHAGSSTITMDKSTYTDGLDETIWHDADGDIQVQNGGIVFSDDSTDATKLITKKDITQIEQLDTILKVGYTMKFSALPEGESFVFGIGLSSLESSIGEEGNLEIVYFNDGGLKVQVNAYETSDTPTVLMEGKSCGSVGSSIKTELELTTSGVLTLKINGTTVYKAEVPMVIEGSVGFLQTGSCGVRVTDLGINMYTYDRPENSNIFEDFESGDFNKNLFGSKMISASNYRPCRLAVEEYNGNQVLMFKNVSKGYFVTKQQYSNFEMTFDIPYMQREIIADEEGNTVTPRFHSMGVSYGGDATGNDNSVTWGGGGDLLLFMGSGVMGYRTNHPMVYATQHEYAAAECEKTPTIKVTVIDGDVKVQVKWADEDDSKYEMMLAYKLDVTPTGYIAIWAPAETATNFAIDNISIKNLDKDAKLVEVDKISSKWVVPDDYDYQPMEKVYRKTETKEEKDRWYLPMLVTAGACVVAIGVTVGVTVLAKRRKDGAEHEK